MTSCCVTVCCVAASENKNDTTCITFLQEGPEMSALQGVPYTSSLQGASEMSALDEATGQPCTTASTDASSLQGEPEIAAVEGLPDEHQDGDKKRDDSDSISLTLRKNIHDDKLLR